MVLAGLQGNASCNRGFYRAIFPGCHGTVQGRQGRLRAFVCDSLRGVGAGNPRRYKLFAQDGSAMAETSACSRHRSFHSCLRLAQTASALRKPPVQLKQHWPQQNVIGRAVDEGGLGNRADEHRRVAALGCPPNPLAEVGVGAWESVYLPGQSQLSGKPNGKV